MVEYSDPYAEEDPPWAPRSYLEKGKFPRAVWRDGKNSAHRNDIHWYQREFFVSLIRKVSLILHVYSYLVYRFYGFESMQVKFRDCLIFY